MMNCSTVLVQNTWGVHFNFEENFSSSSSCPSWLTQLQQQDWLQRGIVVWDAYLRIVAHLCAGYALELLEHLQNNDAWKTNGLVIGSPIFQLSANSVSTLSTKIGGNWILENQIKLSADQMQVLVEFLTEQQSSLEHILSYDREEAKETLSKVYRLIAAYGRRVREKREVREIIESREPKVIPTLIPRGNYFTVYKAAQICHATSKQIRAWIRKGKLEAFDLPGLGLIIEAGNLNEFLCQRNSEPK